MFAQTVRIQQIFNPKMDLLRKSAPNAVKYFLEELKERPEILLSIVRTVVICLKLGLTIRTKNLLSWPMYGPES